MDRTGSALILLAVIAVSTGCALQKDAGDDATGAAGQKRPPAIHVPPPFPSSPPPPSPPRQPENRGAVNPRTGQYLPPSGEGVINPRTGEYYPPVGNGYLNPRTGEFIPKRP